MECGKVAMLNEQTGMFALEREGGLTICELLDRAEIRSGDIITGNLEQIGVQTLCNQTHHFEFRAAIEHLNCSPSLAREALRQ